MLVGIVYDIAIEGIYGGWIMGKVRFEMGSRKPLEEGKVWIGFRMWLTLW